MVEIKIKISDIDYGDIAEKAIPIVIDKMLEKRKGGKLEKALSKLKTLPAAFVKSSLRLLDQDTQDELAAFFLNENRETILGYINSFATDKGVKIKVESLEVEKS